MHLLSGRVFVTLIVVNVYIYYGPAEVVEVYCSCSLIELLLEPKGKSYSYVDASSPDMDLTYSVASTSL